MWIRLFVPVPKLFGGFEGFAEKVIVPRLGSVITAVSAVVQQFGAKPDETAMSTTGFPVAQAPCWALKT
jgi:hypothetical protein